MLFDPALKQCQDSDWLLRLAAAHKLYAGPSDNIVALRRVHRDNRVFNTQERIYFQRKYLRKCISQEFYGSTDRHAMLYVVGRYVSWMWGGLLRRAGVLSAPLIIASTTVYLLIHPGLLFRLFFPKTHDRTRS